MKSFGDKRMSKKLQPLTGTFRGTEHLGGNAGHGPKHVGAICDRADFSGVAKLRPVCWARAMATSWSTLSSQAAIRSLGRMWFIKKSFKMPFHGL